MNESELFSANANERLAITDPNWNATKARIVPRIVGLVTSNLTKLTSYSPTSTRALQEENTQGTPVTTIIIITIACIVIVVTVAVICWLRSKKTKRNKLHESESNINNLPVSMQADSSCYIIPENLPKTPRNMDGYEVPMNSNNTIPELDGYIQPMKINTLSNGSYVEIDFDTGKIETNTDPHYEVIPFTV